MEDQKTPPPSRCAVFRRCEAGRLQRQLLARAYQQICPQVRGVLVDAVDPARPHRQATDSSTARRLAKGA